MLIGHVVRAALKYEMAVVPIFSHCTRHYFRTYLRVRRSRNAANEALSNISYIRHCFRCLGREYSKLDDLGGNCGCGSGLRHAGPLWSGQFADEAFSRRLAAQLSEDGFGTSKEGVKLASQVAEEQEITVPYFDVHKLFSVMKAPAPSMEKISSLLGENGFTSARTHFAGSGLRTDAKVSDIYRIFKK
jgi:tRNA (guanine26-N2/guanine27-N2)-dimethyltransferase